mmetsp:Transcript_101368/g.325767  ORF Transcript_101368/g.325767 Transcript_101368/m.325767 type:complete len:229 (+) Transcript_101368:87-773(+)
MRRGAGRLCDGALAREWVHARGVPADAPRIRVMHFNALADCLAKHAPLLGPRRGFRCTPEALSWEGRSERIKRELLRYDCDVLGVCEVDHYDDFFAPTLEPEGYDGAYKRKRSPAKDGVAIFWRRRRLEEALRRSVFLDRHKGPGSQVALLQRLHVPGAVAGQGRNLVVCSTHLRASKGDDIRMQQAAEVVSALSDFARGDPQAVVDARAGRMQLDKLSGVKPYSRHT